MNGKNRLSKNSLAFHQLYGIGTIKSESVNKQRSVLFLEKNTESIIDERELTPIPYQSDSLFDYDKKTYQVVDVILESNNTVKYRVIQFDPPTNQPRLINMDDYNIVPITKELQVKIKKTRDYCDRYNLAIDQINKKMEKNHLPGDFADITVSSLMNILKKSNLKIKNIENLPMYLKTTKSNTLEIANILKFPFDFIRADLQVISYEKAAKICDDLGITVSFELKCEKWSYDLMHKRNTFYLPSRDFYKYFEDFCRLEYHNNREYLDLMNEFVVNKTINGKLYKTTQYFLDFEKSMTDNMMETFYDKLYNILEPTINHFIDAFEKNTGVTLSLQQRTAVVNSIKYKFYIINGLPGTGKSTIVQCILFVLKKLDPLSNICCEGNGVVYSDGDDGETTISDMSGERIAYDKKCKFPQSKNISILAPTGLAYSGLKNKCESDTKSKTATFNKTISGTCHRAVYLQFPKILTVINKKKNGYVLTESEKELVDIYPELIIIDEFSMIDSFMFKEIIDWCKRFKCRLLILGDENQLPSIGPGCNLKNIIECRLFPQSKLTEIKRQTGVLMNNIKKMTTEKITRDDFTDATMKLLDTDHFVDEDSGKINKRAIINLIQNEQLDKNKTKFITYFKDEKFTFNVTDLNNILQSIYNPISEESTTIHSKSKYKEKFQFRVNDVIIRIENDYSTGDIRANGEQCHITGFYRDKVILKPIEEKTDYTVSVEDLYDCFNLAYALTVHKSQGSQYDNVVVLIDKNQKIWDKSALYTAVSRSKTKCIGISKESEFEQIQTNMRNITDKISLFMIESDNYEFSEEE
jgi:energy-coupling factor transporter ATP-binding protein EcfA2